MRTPSDRLWATALPVCIALLAAAFATDFTAPWSSLNDFNSAVWAQATVNYSRAGLWAGAGMPSIFYFGELPLPAESFYTHHPPMLAWLAFGFTSLLGLHEWTLRLLPAICSFASAILLWRIVARASGLRAAALTTIVFASMPMELTFGRMVNFEPLTLMLLLAAGDRLLAWKERDDRSLPAAAIILLILTTQSSWVGQMLVLPAALASLRHKDIRIRHFGGWTVLAAAIGAVVFVMQIIVAYHAAIPDLVAAFNERLSLSDRVGITWSKWFARVIPSLIGHLSPLWLVFAGGGLVITLNDRQTPASPVIRGALIMLATNVVYLVVFRNASYIHAYAAFYLIVPVAIFAGLALEALITKLHARPLAVLAVLLLATFQAIYAQQKTREFRKPFPLLDEQTAHSEDLAVRLGKVINARFSPHTMVLTNMMPLYGPQLMFYAQRQMINHVTNSTDWNLLKEKHATVGGVLWAGGSGGEQLVETLGRDSLELHLIDGQSFYLWQTTVPSP